jgi:hypothetical protein
MSELDLFRGTLPPADPLHGLALRLPDSCRCGATTATIGEGRGPHAASLRCANCATHRGWLSRKTHSFIAETVSLCGRPTTPITIHRGSGEW